MILEDLQANCSVKGILADEIVTVVSVRWFGSQALELTYKTATGKVAKLIGAGERVFSRYERIAFEKSLVPLPSSFPNLVPEPRPPVNCAIACILFVSARYGQPKQVV